jgi:type IV pilus assembly protein PilN
MARINLLPWREERRQARKKEFFATMGAIALASALAVFGAHYFMQVQIEKQLERNAAIQAEIDSLKQKIEKIKNLELERARLLKRKEIIEQLQGSRSLMVHLFEEIATTTPDGVVLSGIKQTADSIQMFGRAQSEARVAQYMRNLDASPWMKDPDLGEVAAQDASTIKPAGAVADTSQAAGRGGANKNFALTVKVETAAPAAAPASVLPVEATPSGGAK